VDQTADRVDHADDPGVNPGRVAAAASISDLAATTEQGSAMDPDAYGLRCRTPVRARLLWLHAQSTLEGGTPSREKGEICELPGGLIKEMARTDGVTEVVAERGLGGKE
jgi:hypothetical protein